MKCLAGFSPRTRHSVRPPAKPTPAGKAHGMGVLGLALLFVHHKPGQRVGVPARLPIAFVTASHLQPSLEQAVGATTYTPEYGVRNTTTLPKKQGEQCVT